MELFILSCRTWHIPLMSFLRFLLAHFSRLARSFWMVVRKFSYHYVGSLSRVWCYWNSCLDTTVPVRPYSAKALLCSSPFIYGVWQFPAKILFGHVRPSPLLRCYLYLLSICHSVVTQHKYDQQFFLSSAVFFNTFFSYLNFKPKWVNRVVIRLQSWHNPSPKNAHNRHFQIM